MTATQPLSNQSAPRQLQSRQLLGVNQQTYQSLKASLSLDLRRQLLIAVCDSVEMQEQIATQLEYDIRRELASNGLEDLSDNPSANQAKPIDRLIFDADDGNLPQQIANWMRHTLFTLGDLPRLQLLGIEQMTRQPAITQNYFLRSLDKIEALLPRLNTSLLVWVPWPWLRTIQQSSPTFWNWRNGVFEFVSDPTPTPASREALDIDISMFEPERASQNAQIDKPKLPDAQPGAGNGLNAEITPNPHTNGGSASLVESTKNGHENGHVENAAAKNGHVESAAAKNGHIVSTAANNGYKATTQALSTPVTEPIEPSKIAANDFQDAFQSALSAPPNLEKVSHAEEGDQPHKAAVDTPIAEAPSDNSLPEDLSPLEFWDDDDFPIFNSNIEAEAEKIDQAEELSVIESSKLDFSTESASTGEQPSTLSTNTNAPSNQAQENLGQSLGQTAAEQTTEPAQETVPEPTKAPTVTPINLIATTAEPTLPTNVGESAAPIAPGNRQQETRKPVAPKRKKRQRKIIALGGLRSTVSQGVNVSSSDDDANLNSSSTSDETAAQPTTDNPADLLDALSNQVPYTRAADKSSATEIPILVKKNTASDHSNSDQPRPAVAPAKGATPAVAQTPTIATQALATTHATHEQDTETAQPADVQTEDIPVAAHVETKQPEAKQLETKPQSIRQQVTAQLQISQSVRTKSDLTEEQPTQRTSAQQPTREALVEVAPNNPTDKHATAAEADTIPAQAQNNNAAQFFAEGLAYRNRIEAGERDLTVIEPAIAAYEKGLDCLRDNHPDWVTGLNDLGTLYWLKAQHQSEKNQAITCMENSIHLYQKALQKGDAASSTETNSKSVTSETEAPSGAVPSGITGQLYSNMGAVFTMLATCKDPVDYLTQAADSYQKALLIVSLATNPAEYATLQNSLGSVFWKLSHYESVETHLHQAIAAYNEALLGYESEAQPLDYAAVQNNLGITYWSLAKHEQPQAFLKQAIAAYRDALNYRTSDVDPAACAISYNNLALAYWDLSKHTHRDLAQKSRYQKNAVTAFEAALNINNLSGALSPMDSAAIYHCLGDVHAQMTETAPSTVDIGESLQKSLYSYVKSLENLSTDSPAYPPRFGAIVANLRLHYEKLGLEGQQAALNRIPANLLPQVMMAL